MSSRKYQAPKSKTVAAVLAFFFGGIGVHRFYLREPGIGFVFIFIALATATMNFPVSMFIGFFEAIRFLRMDQATFDKRYNRYSSQNRKDDYLQKRAEKRSERSSRRTGRRTNRPAPRRAINKPNPFKSSGIKKYKDYDFEGAIEDFEQGLEINPQDVALHFNIACAYSLTEDKDKAFYHLDTAVDLGFKDFEMIKTKDDLAFVRIQPEFEAFAANGFQMGKGQTRNQKTQKAEEITDDILLSQLNKLAELRKKGLLSEEEFSIERQKLLRR